MTDLKKFLHDLNSIKQTKEPRLEILIIQLYMEHFLNEIINYKTGNLPSEIVKENLSIPVKTKIIEKWELINKDHKKVIDALAKTRNDLVHNLIIDFKKVEKRLKSVNFDFIRNEKGKRVKLLSRLKPYNRLKFSSMLIIGILYHKLLELKGKPCLQTFNLELERKDDDWDSRIKLIERSLKSKEKL